jgi:hypothetical protein
MELYKPNGANISNFNVSWDVEQYTQGGRPTKIDFDYDANGAGATQTGITGTTLTTAQTGIRPLGQISPVAPRGWWAAHRHFALHINIPGRALADGQSIDFRWITTGNDPSGGNAHFAVDNLSVTAFAVPERVTSR